MTFCSVVNKPLCFSATKQCDFICICVYRMERIIIIIALRGLFVLVIVLVVLSVHLTQLYSSERLQVLKSTLSSSARVFRRTYLILMANSPPSFCRTRKVPSERGISRFLAPVRSRFPANLQEKTIVTRLLEVFTSLLLF